MSDREQFEERASVLHGDRVLSSELLELSRWISDTFMTEVVNMMVDALHDGTPRLSVWVRTAAQARAFLASDGVNYDETKQAAISQQYVLTLRKRLWSRASPEPPFVVFKAFELEARNRAIDLPPTELEALRERLANPALWSIKVSWGRVVFFVYTGAEADTLRDSQEYQRWTAEFLRAIGPRDEFDVVQSTPPLFELDSKERFDREFQGNGYYYFR